MTSIEGLGAPLPPLRPITEPTADTADAQVQKTETPRDTRRVEPVGASGEAAGSAARRAQDDTAEALFSARTRDIGRALPDSLRSMLGDTARADETQPKDRDGIEVPFLGKISDEQERALEQAERAKRQPLTFVEKVAIAAAADNLPANAADAAAKVAEETARSVAAASYGVDGTPGARAAAVPQVDITV